MNKIAENVVDVVNEISPVKGKKMIAVLSGAQSSGKTFFSYNLCQALSLFKKKVMFFDGNCGLNNIKTQLGLNYANDLDAVIYGNRSINQVAFTYDKGKFDIIPGNSGSSAMSTMSIGRLQILGDDLNILSNSYDNMILDIGIEMKNVLKVFAGMSKNIIIICNDEPQTITESYNLIRFITLNYPKNKINIVVNMVNNIEDGLRVYELLKKACSEFLNITPSLLGVVRTDTRVRDSIRNQSTIINRYPQSEASSDIIAIAKRIANDE